MYNLRSNGNVDVRLEFTWRHLFVHLDLHSTFTIKDYKFLLNTAHELSGQYGTLYAQVIEGDHKIQRLVT